MSMQLPKTMKALQLFGVDQLVMTDLPVPEPQAGEVLIKTMASTICTSDLHDIKHNPFGIARPKVLGHEGAGVEIKCGPGITACSVGDRVATPPVAPCGNCTECRRGFGHLCQNMEHLGIDRNGTLA